MGGLTAEALAADLAGAFSTFMGFLGAGLTALSFVLAFPLAPEAFELDGLDLPALALERLTFDLELVALEFAAFELDFAILKYPIPIGS